MIRGTSQSVSVQSKWFWLKKKLLAARPGAGVQARTSVAVRAFRVHQVDRGENLRGRKPPVWAFVNLPMNDASSTEIRARGGWKSGRS